MDIIKISDKYSDNINESYIAPDIETIEFVPEKGFALSDLGEGADPFGG